jgi:UDP-2-acetamido-2,6-beta-L-arabino-hexul-4-ose reductase
MKILITGSEGFIGKNLVSVLQYHSHHTLFLVNRQTDHAQLHNALHQADVIYHFAGESRSRSEQAAFQRNLDYTRILVDHSQNHTRFIFLSTNKQTHPAYWQTKLKEEALVKTKTNFDILRLDNVFGKWAKPFYNSVVATFIHGLIYEKSFQLFQEHDPIDFIYIDDLVNDLILLLEQKASNQIILKVGTFHTNAATLLKHIKEIHQDYSSGSFLQYQDEFKSKLSLTYLSYLPEQKLLLPLVSHVDQRGQFIDIMKGTYQGQWSINVTNSKAIKGNHFHHVRWEKFIVIHGTGKIKLRKKFDDHVIIIDAETSRFKSITIPPGYVHQLINDGQDELVIWMWSSLAYDPTKPDTYPELVSS